MRNCRLMPSFMAISILLTTAPSAEAIFLDGKGHYGARGLTRTHNSFSTEQDGLHQVIEKSFRFEAELRASDRVSFFGEMRLWDDPHQAFFGDTSQPRQCVIDENGTRGFGEQCLGQHQSTSYPGYAPLRPFLSKAYAQFAFDYCILQVGRRPRHWGMGILLNEGTQAFDREWSVYDGIGCDVNIQQSQTLGFSFGYDKITETGISPDLRPEHQQRFAMGKDAYGLNQFYVTLEYDDRKANAGSAFTRKIGIYLSNLLSFKGKEHLEQVQTDVKFADLYTSLNFYNLSLENEILFRQGTSSEPGYILMGGVASKVSESPLETDYVRQKVDAIGLAGKVNYVLAKTGSIIGPEQYNQGNYSSHALFLRYAYAPGDQDGYYDLGQRARGGVNVTGMAFNRNFQPALILFNARPGAYNTFVDGVFAPDQIMNAVVLSTGYRYESLQNGNVEIRLIGASLSSGMPDAVKSEQEGRTKRMIGYDGNIIGYEVDVLYDKKFGKDSTAGVGLGYALPGPALNREVGTTTPSSMHIEASVTVHF